MIIVTMGVAGAGKTTVGQALAAALGWRFLDADSLHSVVNIEKMAHGIPLDDSDRAPWLAAIHFRIAQSFGRGEHLVVACSALKQCYRQLLAQDVAIVWIYLKAGPEVIRGRLCNRRLHYMQADMLCSQFADLEEPADAIVIDATAAPASIVHSILDVLAVQKK